MLADKLVIKGQEVIYLKYEGDSPHQEMKWIDETIEVYYHIHDIANSKLNKQQFLQIADQFIK